MNDLKNKMTRPMKKTCTHHSDKTKLLLAAYAVAASWYRPNLTNSPKTTASSLRHTGDGNGAKVESGSARSRFADAFNASFLRRKFSDRRFDIRSARESIWTSIRWSWDCCFLCNLFGKADVDVAVVDVAVVAVNRLFKEAGVFITTGAFEFWEDKSSVASALALIIKSAASVYLDSWKYYFRDWDNQIFNKQITDNNSKKMHFLPWSKTISLPSNQ